jgi:hypothetical protein
MMTAAVAMQAQAQTFPTNGLVLWNTLGSQQAITNSAFGPNLDVYSGGGFPDVPATQAFVPGLNGDALTIGPGGYISEDRVHNVVFNNLGQYLNSNSGTIDVWYKQNADPVPYQNGVVRLFDGSYGLGAGMGLESDPLPAGLSFGLSFGGAGTGVSYDISGLNGSWINVAGVWDVAGIDGSADKLRLYVNGQVVASSAGASWGGSVGSTADIGGGQDGDCANQFDLEQLLVYNRALSAGEVSQLYSAEAAPIVSVQKAVYLTSNNLLVGSNYQIQVSPDLTNWTNYGSVFLATNAVWQSTMYWSVANWNQLYFRVKLAP